MATQLNGKIPYQLLTKQKINYCLCDIGINEFGVRVLLSCGEDGEAGEASSPRFPAVTPKFSAFLPPPPTPTLIFACYVQFTIKMIPKTETVNLPKLQLKYFFIEPFMYIN